MSASELPNSTEFVAGECLSQLNARVYFMSHCSECFRASKNYAAYGRTRNCGHADECALRRSL